MCVFACVRACVHAFVCVCASVCVCVCVCVFMHEYVHACAFHCETLSVQHLFRLNPPHDLFFHTQRPLLPLLPPGGGEEGEGGELWESPSHSLALDKAVC